MAVPRGSSASIVVHWNGSRVVVVTNGPVDVPSHVVGVVNEKGLSGRPEVLRQVLTI